VPFVDGTDARDGVKELHSRARPVRATDMGFVAAAHYPHIQKAASAFWDAIPNP
jgi:hypothetical protein